ncbi:MAG: type II toxin-antitoxin system RelE/ParE family toxin [Candidatus Thermoplasmatota archaeon]|jgi:mRNA interferase RelE/StbE|nr:type II toxin-antitoxin system RelE/ParE family toxin [Candidatus Thermoplasmatota archaeon]
MSYEVVLTAEAEEFLKKHDISVRRRIENKLLMLEKNPELGKPLAAILRGLRSLRIGDHRVIYHIKNAELIVLVINIGNRKNVYS